MANLTADQNRPMLDMDTETNEWVLKVDCAAWVRVPAEQRALACQIFDAATWAYHNGRRDVQHEMQHALGVK